MLNGLFYFVWIQIYCHASLPRQFSTIILLVMGIDVASKIVRAAIKRYKLDKEGPHSNIVIAIAFHICTKDNEFRKNIAFWNRLSILAVHI